MFAKKPPDNVNIADRDIRKQEQVATLAHQNAAIDALDFRDASPFQVHALIKESCIGSRDIDVLVRLRGRLG